MNALKLVPLLIFLHFNSATAANHSGHSGSGNKNDGLSCGQLKITPFDPIALSEVTQGSDFSFKVFADSEPSRIEVKRKKNCRSCYYRK